MRSPWWALLLLGLCGANNISTPSTLSPTPSEDLSDQYLTAGLILAGLFLLCLMCVGASKGRRQRERFQNVVEEIRPAAVDLLPPTGRPDGDGSKIYDEQFGAGFSGGGVRSASFCSGVLFGLMNSDKEAQTDNIFKGGNTIALPKGILPKYYSCVSGGGYVGASFTYWARMHRGQDPRTWSEDYFRQMRKGIAYYCDCSTPMNALYDIVTILTLFATLFFLSLLAFIPTTYVLAEFILLPYSGYYNLFSGDTNTSLGRGGYHTALLPTTPEAVTFESINNDMFMLIALCICSGWPIFIALDWIVAKKATEELKKCFLTDIKSKRPLRCWKTVAEMMSHLNYAYLTVFTVLAFVVIFDFTEQDAMRETAIVWSLRVLLVVLFFIQQPGLGPLFLQAQLVIWVYYSPHHALMIPPDTDFDTHYRFFAIVSKIMMPFMAVVSLLRERQVFEFSRWRLSKAFFNIPGRNFAKDYWRSRKEGAANIGKVMWNEPRFGQYPTYIACTTANGWMAIPSSESLVNGRECEQELEFDFYWDHLAEKDRIKVAGILRKALGFQQSSLAMSIGKRKSKTWSFPMSKKESNDLSSKEAQAVSEAVTAMRHAVMSDESKLKLVQEFEDNKQMYTMALLNNLRELAWAQASAAYSKYDILAMSTEGWWERYEDGHTDPTRILPRNYDYKRLTSDCVIGANPNLLLNEAMCMSAAAGSLSNGEFGGLREDAQRSQVMFGLHMGRWVETTVERSWSHIACLLLVEFIIALPIIILGGTDDPFARTDMDVSTGTNNGDYAKYLGGALSLVVFLLWSFSLPLWAVWFPKLYPFLPRARDLLTLTRGTLWSHSIPSMLYISDGGHTENLGLCPLLARRLQYIVIACGAEDETCEALQKSLEQARLKLGCRFASVRADQQRRGVDRVTSEVELDLLQDIQFFARDNQRVMVIEVFYREPKRDWKAQASRAFNPGVESARKRCFIFYLKPIPDHPKGFIEGSSMLRDEPFGANCVRPIPAHYGSLGGCCCESCHRVSCLRSIGGSFPFHHTAFQFFTPLLFDAYHAQGVQAAKDALKVALQHNNTEFKFERRDSWIPGSPRTQNTTRFVHNVPLDVE